MLTNYDAKAVAEVMNIGFLQGPKRKDPTSATPAEGAKPGTAATIGRFDINVDDSVVRLIDMSEWARRAGRAAEADRLLLTAWEICDEPSPVLIEKAVEKGLPRLALRHVAEQIAGGDKAKISSLEWSVVPKTTLERRGDQLSPQESERTERLARLYVHARRALGSEAEARAFMTAPHPLLDGRSPIDAARTDLATRRTEQILNALEYGLAL